ncbi:hypothetical protein C8Q80DRAFT_385025 [Daedaleopsis nitida]|nr:hypothetical protein C8Q80DRAFT_385025 [Daedaleopsis nitida]
MPSWSYAPPRIEGRLEISSRFALALVSASRVFCSTPESHGVFRKAQSSNVTPSSRCRSPIDADVETPEMSRGRRHGSQPRRTKVTRHVRGGAAPCPHAEFRVYPRYFPVVGSSAVRAGLICRRATTAADVPIVRIRTRIQASDGRLSSPSSRASDVARRACLGSCGKLQTVSAELEWCLAPDADARGTAAQHVRLSTSGRSRQASWSPCSRSADSVLCAGPRYALPSKGGLSNPVEPCRRTLSRARPVCDR